MSSRMRRSRPVVTPAFTATATAANTRKHARLAPRRQGRRRGEAGRLAIGGKPARGGFHEMLSARAPEAAFLRVPCHAFDGNAPVLRSDDIEGIGFIAPARGGCGACLHKDDGPAPAAILRHA